MLAYIILYILTILFCVMETSVQSVKIGSKHIKIADISFVFLGICILLFGIFRGETVGADDLNYKINYWERCQSLSFWKAVTLDNDFGFIILNWLVGRFVSEFYIFRAVLFTITFMSIALWIKKYSSNVSLSIFMYLSLGFLYFDFGILRQALAISIFIWCYEFLMERKFIKFFFLILMAALCHKTAFFVLALYPLLTFKIKNGRQIIKYCYLFGFIILTLLVDNWVSVVYSRNDYALDRGEGGGRLLIFYCLFFIVLYFFMKKSEYNERCICEFQIALSTVYFQIIALGISIATRMLQYTTTYLFLLVPHIMDGLDRKTQKVFLFTVIVAMSVLFFRELGDYEPYVTWLM